MLECGASRGPLVRRWSEGNPRKLIFPAKTLGLLPISPNPDPNRRGRNRQSNWWQKGNPFKSSSQSVLAFSPNFGLVVCHLYTMLAPKKSRGIKDLSIRGIT